MNQALDTLALLSHGLIRAEVKAASERSMLERAAISMVRDSGYSIDEVSAASGLPPSEIKVLLKRPKPLETIEDLIGIA